jgi:hypothetical protein
MKILNCFLIVVAALISASGAGVSGSPDSHSGRSSSPEDISIVCPAQIEYRIQPIADWDAGLYGIKRWAFDDAAVVGRTINCTYSAINGDSSTLTRPMPAGYICTVLPSVNKNRQFNCKRAVPPIKIKPKTD